MGESRSHAGSARSSMDRTAASAGPKQDGVKHIQDENAELHKAVRAISCHVLVLGSSCGCRVHMSLVCVYISVIDHVSVMISVMIAVFSLERIVVGLTFF